MFKQLVNDLATLTLVTNAAGQSLGQLQSVIDRFQENGPAIRAAVRLIGFPSAAVCVWISVGPWAIVNWSPLRCPEIESPMGKAFIRHLTMETIFLVNQKMVSGFETKVLVSQTKVPTQRP